MRTYFPARLRREFLIVSIGQLASFVGAVVTVKLLTHVLEPEQYGLLALALTAVTLSQQVAFSPVLGAASRFYSAAAQSGQLRSFIKGLTIFCLGATSIVIVALVAAVPIAWQQRVKYGALLLPLSGLIILTALNSVASAIQSAARQRTIAALHDSSGQWLRGIFAWLLISLFSSTAAFALWGQLAASALVLVSQAVFIVRLFRSGRPFTPAIASSMERLTTRAMWRFAWPYSAYGIFYWCGVASERWSLSAVHGLGTVGIYQAAYQLGYTPVYLCLTAVQAFVNPIVFERVGDGSDSTKLRQASRLILTLTIWTVAGTLFLAVAASSLGPTLYKLLTGAAYKEGVGLLPLAVLSAGLFSAGQFMSLNYLTARQSNRLIYPKAVSSALVTVFAWIGANWAGAFGVFVGSNAANVIYLALIWVLSPTHKAVAVIPQNVQQLEASCVNPN